MRGNRGATRDPRQWLPSRIPDPLRAHGAWVYLAASILCGALVGTTRGIVPGALAGGSFVGGFVLAGALAKTGSPAAGIRGVTGVLLATGAALAAFRLGADRSFLAVGLIAIPPALAAAYLAAVRGFLSPGALSLGVTALVVSAPVAARAAGASLGTALGILALLAPFFTWRTWRLARALAPGWTKQRLRRRGLLESALAAGWSALTLAVVRALA